MKVFEGLNFQYKFKNAVVTVGSYDGVHMAHKLILNRICNIAKQINGESVLVTFDPHPRQVLTPELPFGILTSRRELISLLENIGIDVLIIIPFTIDFSNMSSEEFVKDILVEKINTKKIVVGYNHFFGHNREGNFEYLKNLGKELKFEVEEIPEQDIQNESVSSSKIRQAINEGNIIKANAYLDYEYSVSGLLCKSDEVFNAKGFCTWLLNVENENKLIPANGLYFAHTFISGKSLQTAAIVTCNNGLKKQIFILLNEKNSEIEGAFTTLQFKHLVRSCHENTNCNELNQNIEALIFQAIND